MQISIIALGNRMPTWINQGFQEYNKRLPRELAVSLIEIPILKRRKGVNINKIIEQEGTEMIAALGKNDHVIALERKGKDISTQALAEALNAWKHSGQNISLLIGGPEGLSSQCLEKAHELWSLSSLTLPHPLVRVVLIEQIYRAWSILAHHPYHR